jgi:hypothetical protein
MAHNPNTNGKQPTATISDLPPELFEAIAQGCETEDLLNLRQVNHDIEGKTPKVFGERMFTAKAFMLFYKDSLRRLVANCEDRRLGPYVRKVTPSHLMSFEPEEDASYTYDEEAKAMLKANWSKQQALIRTGLHKKLLSQAFKAIRGWHNPVDIELDSCEWMQWEPYVWATLDIPMVQSTHTERAPTTGAFSLILDAVRLSGVHVQRLHIENSSRFDFGDLAHHDQGGTLDWICKHARKGVYKVEELDLCLMSSKPATQADADKVLTMLSAWTTLKKLTLDNGPAIYMRHGRGQIYDEETTTTERALLRANLPGIKSLRLIAMMLDFGDLVALLKRHRNMRIELCDIMFRRAPIVAKRHAGDSDERLAKVLEEAVGHACESVKSCKSFMQ